MKRALIALLSAFAALPALAGTPFRVEVDHTQLIELPTDPGSIVIGNPSIADVALNGRQMFINGHAYGETNLMIFDSNGKKIADYEVSVGHGSTNQVTMFIGQSLGGQGSTTKRLTYVCNPTCENSIMVGDDNMAAAIKDTQAKTSFANGVTPSGVNNNISTSGNTGNSGGNAPKM